MGRPAKYDWNDKKEICRRLFVEEKLSAGQIVQYFAKRFNVPESELPNSNQFSTKFKKWGFPARKPKKTEDEEAQILARTRELFSQNYAARDIQKALNDEGWEMDNYRFRKLRAKHGMLMRNEAGGYKPHSSGNKRKRTSAEDEEDEAVGGAEDEDRQEIEDASQMPALSPEEQARRAQRAAELQIRDDELYRTGKRRRRIRGYGHLPPDNPAPPRYGSETSLDECKAFLQLSNGTYLQARNEFEAICREMGIIKMTLCAEGQWQVAKDRLVRENMHLSSMLHPLQPNLDQRINALNCICTDVTKRMRNMAKKLSMADANNILGLDPAVSKDIRRILYEILEADHFTTVVACGREHLQDLREDWYAKSPLLRQAIDTHDPQKLKAIDLLCKDARKRYCDDQLRKHPEKRNQQKHYGPGPGPAQGFAARADAGPKTVPTQPLTTSTQAKRTTVIPVGPSWNGHEVPDWRMSTIADGPAINFDLDPLLHENNHGPSYPPAHVHPAPPQQASSIPAYFRLSPDSRVVGAHPKMWLGKLTNASVASLRQAATSKAGASRVAKVHGIVKNVDDSEDRWLIENDDELSVYLEEAGEKATFVVVLEGGYA